MNAYKKYQERKRLQRAVKNRFPEIKKTVTDNLPKQRVQIDKNTVVLAPEAASTLQIRSRYEQNN